jgi:hypothetical protein
MRWKQLFLAAIAFAEAAAAAPNVVVTAFPRGMVQVSGGAATNDSFTVANIGTTAAVIDFLRNGNFFSVSPSSLSLSPGASQSITIRGSSQPGGVFNGSITISGSGVPANGIVIPVRLMTGPIPAGTVDPQPSILRVDVAGPPGQAHSRDVSFHNGGNAAMQGIAVSDAAWIVPQSELVNIAPARNGVVTFSADPSKRPDAPSPLGAFAGTLSLRFLNGNGVGQTVSVSIVDVVRPGVSAGEPPALTAGEIALFVPGLSSRNQVLSDLFLSARRGEPAITDLKLFYTQLVTGSSSLVATIAQPPTGLAPWFPSILQSVFSRVEQVGTLQLRGSQTTNVSLTTIQVSSLDVRVFSSPLPILRSDRGIGPGESLLLAGVEKSASLNTNVYLQELSGSAASAQTEFFDATGAPVGSRRTDTINPFRGLELLDIVPAAARSVRVTNTGSAAKIAAAALVADNATQASWAVIDPSRSVAAPTDTWLVPLITPPAGSTTEVFVGNTTTATTNVTIDTFTPSVQRRRRAVHTNALQTATLRPLETLRTTVNAPNSMLRVTGPAGTVSTSARITTTNPGRVGSFGTSLPIVTVNTALSASQGTRFTGVDDWLATRSSLILAEIGGLAATVRVTLRYSFVAGVAVSAQGLSSKDFSVSAGQMLTINDLARSVIGSQRDTFGNLRNMQVDVEVIDGGGRIIPFIQSIDNSSGDITVRAE